MIMKRNHHVSLTALLVSAALLSACGESDLKEQHDAELESARAALSDAPSAEPDGNDTEDGEPSEGTVDQTTLGAANAELDLDEYTLVFSDEFDGSEIDAEKWNTALPWGSDFVINGEDQYYVDTQNEPDFGYDPFVLDGRSLSIKAVPLPEGYGERANGQSWLSGALSSFEKFDFTYGYVEARVHVPTGKALWPAFWMLSTDYVDRKPQIFIMEHDGATPESVFVNYNFANEDDELSTFGQREYETPGFADGFNIVALEWSPEALNFMINGQVVRSIPAGSLPEQDMYLIMNLAVGGTWVDDPDESTPVEPGYRIDYVRVYRKDGQ